MAKAITPVISVILLLLITISIVGFAMIFMQRSVSSASQESEQQLTKQASSLGENFEVININGNQVTVRNKGTAELKNLAFYVDGNPVTVTDPATGNAIPKDGIGTFTLDAGQLAQYPGRKLKVSSAGLTKEQDADFYAKNTVAYYTFDSTDGRTIRDESGKGNDGIFKGEETKWNDGTLADANVANQDGNKPPQKTAGKYGSALGFDGVDDYVDAGSGASLTGVTQGDFSVEAWFKTSDSVSRGAIMGSCCDAAGSTNFEIRATGEFRVYLNGGADDWQSNRADLVDGQWHHAVLTRDVSADTQYLYLDGKLDKTYTDTAGAYTSVSGYYIGNDRRVNADIAFNGLIDEVRIYNKALSPQEISEDMNSAYPIERPAASYSFEKIENNKVLDTHNVVKGRYGAAISFDGANDYVNTPINNFVGLTKLTYEAWIKPDFSDNSCRRIIDKGGGRSTMDFSCYSGGKLSFTISNGATVGATTARPPANVWAHVAGTYDGANVRIYVNGELKDTQAQTGAIEDVADNLAIGANNGGALFFWNGAIDEVRILNKAIG